MLRLLHTSDWHLGHQLHDYSRVAEHRAFLTWLAKTVADERIDAVLIAGDVFDTANPSAESQRMFYEFLADLRSNHRTLDVVVIGGNHDSAARLDAPAPLFRALRLHVVGGLAPRDAGGALDPARLVYPLHDAQGAVAARVCAVPFLRPMDLARGDGSVDVVSGARALYAELVAAARSQSAGGEAVIAMGHCYAAGGEASELSERRIVIGGQDALPVDVFGDGVAYVALGHLHKAQRVAGRDHVRYSGAPIAMSLPEFGSGYAHAVNVVEIEGDRAVSIRAVPVPRTVACVTIPAHDDDPVELGTLETLLGTVDFGVLQRDEELRSFLEVRVKLTRPEPTLRHRIGVAIHGKNVRLARIDPSFTGTGAALAAIGVSDLRDLEPEDVFRRKYLGKHAAGTDGDVPADLLACFHELMTSVGAKVTE